MDDGLLERAAAVDTGALYEHVRRDVAVTVVRASDAELERRVPATPAWSVKDVLAHVVGIASDLNAQRFPDAADPGGSIWTDRQVARARGRTVGDLVAEWDGEAAEFEAGLRTFGYEFGSHFVADLHAHSLDMRNALHLRADAEELATAVALDHYSAFIHERLTEQQWGILEVVTGSEDRQLGGQGRYRARVSAPAFEVLRVLSGRRSARQIRALEWSGDGDDFVAFMGSALGPGYALRETDLIEER